MCFGLLSNLHTFFCPRENAYDKEEEQPVIEPGTEDERKEEVTGQINARY